MTDSRTSKERDKTQDALGELYGWLIDLANESSPYDSQMLMKAASIVGDLLATPRDDIEHLRRENVRWENAHKILLADNDRLRKQVEELSIHAEKWVKRALGSTPEPEPALDDHSELMKKLPNVRPELLAEITKQSKWALERRVLIQADWLGSYSKCLDGFGLRYGVDGCWNPRDIREAVEKLRAAQPPRDGQ